MYKTIQKKNCIVKHFFDYEQKILTFQRRASCHMTCLLSFYLIWPEVVGRQTDMDGRIRCSSVTLAMQLLWDFDIVVTANAYLNFFRQKDTRHLRNFFTEYFNFDTPYRDVQIVSVQLMFVPRVPCLLNESLNRYRCSSLLGGKQ